MKNLLFLFVYVFGHRIQSGSDCPYSQAWTVCTVRLGLYRQSGLDCEGSQAWTVKAVRLGLYRQSGLDCLYFDCLNSDSSDFSDFSDYLNSGSPKGFNMNNPVQAAGAARGTVASSFELRSSSTLLTSAFEGAPYLKYTVVQPRTGLSERGSAVPELRCACSGLFIFDAFGVIGYPIMRQCLNYESSDFSDFPDKTVRNQRNHKNHKNQSSDNFPDRTESLKQCRTLIAQNQRNQRNHKNHKNQSSDNKIR
jgi:hypothetical protein